MSIVADTETAEERPTKNGPVLKRCFKDFLKYTTAHGCERLVVSKGFFWKIFWITLFISAHVSFWFHTVIIVQGYLRKPIRTKVTVQRNKVLDFPVVTLCNRNMLRQSKLTDKFKVQVNSALNETAEMWEKKHKKKNASDAAVPGVLHFMSHRTAVMREIVSKERPEALRQMGHQFKDMVLDCVFDGKDCLREQYGNQVWRHLWIEDVGNCYMFNRVLPGDKIKSHQTILTGDQYGLRLLINTEQYDYLKAFSPYAGIKVIIGTQGEMPFPLDDGINVGPGLSTNIEVEMRQSTRLDPFNNKCCERKERLDHSNIYSQYNMTYSKKACRVSCMSKLQEQHCNCSQFYFTGNHNIGYCVTSNQETGECIVQTERLFLKGTCEESCPPRCLETDFLRTISTFKWPAHNFQTSLKDSLHRFANVSLNSQEISDNLLELHIYYANMDSELVEETLKYEFEDLISSIGGQMGIWIGVSALTIAELAEFFWIMIAAVSHKKKNVPDNGFTPKEKE